MSSPDYKYRVNKPRQVLKQIEVLPVGKPKKKLKICKRLKGEHEYEYFRTQYKDWLDFKCRGCGKRTYIIKPFNPPGSIYLWRKLAYDSKDLAFIEKYKGDKSIFYDKT